MTREEIQAIVLETLGGIAPEAEMNAIDPRAQLRDQLDIDSMDFLNFVIALDKRVHVAVPESDYSKIATLEGCVAYLADRVR